MTDNPWKWKNGRLVFTSPMPDNPTVSFSIGEAFHLIPDYPQIAEACEDVLDPYKRKVDGLKE